MDFILQQITDWLKEMLISAIMGNLSGMFESVNNQVGEIATSVGRTPASFSPEIFAMVRNISESVIIPIAGLILTFISSCFRCSSWQCTKKTGSRLRLSHTTLFRRSLFAPKSDHIRLTTTMTYCFVSTNSKRR